MFVLFVRPPVLTGPLWCGPWMFRTAPRSLGLTPKTGPQWSGPVWFAVLAVPFRGLGFKAAENAARKALESIQHKALYRIAGAFITTS